MIPTYETLAKQLTALYTEITGSILSALCVYDLLEVKKLTKLENTRSDLNSKEISRGKDFL